MSHGETRIEAVFLRALEIPSPQERAAYLQEACAGDDELRRRVERMLAAQPQLGSFLDQNAADIVLTTHQSATERPGSQIGPYKLLQQIGEGGMGVVFMAEQSHPVQREVALKVIRPGMDSRQVIARFEAERQALAMMDHVNIARVLDAGATESGRPYFVMELVHGVPITKYCDDNQLTPRERLELFVPVCQAIQHAHQKGVIHRDVKPSNVMITLYDGKPVPKVIDFGVAKATEQKLTERTLFTQYGAMVGTLEYMSPEQAEMSALGVDTRSDIYSLGVLLYELLTGNTPLSHKTMKEAAYAEILRMIKEDEPPKPSTRLSDSGEALASISANRHMEPAKLTKLVRGELDWIVMKTLEKDRNRRYETANGFSMDVQRYLADEAVLACPPSAGYRLRKFVRRNKGPVLVAAGFAVLVALGIAGLIIGIVAVNAERQLTANGLVQVTAEQAKTKLALAAETRARAAEHHARDQTMTALRAMTDDIVENQMARDTNLTEENKEFLRKIIKHFEGFAALTADDADSRSIRAEGHARVGTMRRRLGELKEAETAYADALAIRKQLAADFPTRPEFRQALARTHSSLGNLLRATGRLKEAETAYADALAIQKQLAADFPTRPELRHALAMSHNSLGLLLGDTGRLKEAETAYADAMAIQKQLAADFPNQPEFRLELATSQFNLGNLLRARGRLKEAETAYADALAIQKQLAADFPTRPELRHALAMSHNSLAVLLGDTGRLKEAETAYVDALAIQKQLAADFPTRPDFRQELAASHNNFGVLLKSTGRLKEAETAYVDALAIQKQLAADFPNQPDLRNDVTGSLGNLARLCNQRRDFKTAKAYLEEAQPHHQAALKANPRSPDYRQFFQYDLIAMVHANAGLQDQAAAVQAAQKLCDLPWDPPGNAYDAGCALALCIPVVQEGDQLDAAKRQAAVQFYGDQAMAMLRDAVAKGFKDAEHMKQDKDLDALRERDDFKKLLTELPGKKK
jgi:eukaryotic-like serine/threonine-protein kinase